MSFLTRRYSNILRKTEMKSDMKSVVKSDMKSDIKTDVNSRNAMYL